MENTFNGIYLSGHRRIVGQMKTEATCITWKGDDSTLKYEPSDIKEALWCKIGGKFQLRFVFEGGNHTRFDGFRRSDYDVLKPYLEKVFQIDIKDDVLGSTGVNWGSTDFEGPQGDENVIMKDSEGRRLFELGLSELSQCAFPAKNEVELQFVEEDTTKTTEESLVSMSFFVPQADEEERVQKEDTAAYRLQQLILERAGLINNNGNMIAEVNSQMGKFMTPRGRYTMEFYDNYMRMNGNNYTYKILYKTISSIYMLDQPDVSNKALVFCLQKPLRQGQQTYPHLVLYAPTDRYTINLRLEESVLNERYGGKLQSVMRDEGYKLIAKLFKFVGNVKLFSSDTFHTSRGFPYVRCVHKSEGGLLYFMERTLFFIHKPTLQIAYDDILSVTYHRYDPSSHTGNKMFDIQLKLKGQNGASIYFHNMEYADFSAVNAKFKSKEIRQLGLKQQSMATEDSDSDDEDFDQNSAANEQSEDVDYHGEGDDGMSETSDTDEMMKELEPESDDEKMAIEHSDDENNPPVFLNDLRFQNKLLCSIVCCRMIDVQGLNEGKDDYPDKPRFKKCVIWSPLAPVTYFVPCIGHIAIADSQGNTYDFHGTGVIGKNNMLFGYPTKIMQMADPGIDDEVWDNTLKQSILKYQGETYNFLTNNCHDFAACTLNELSLPQFKGKKFDTNSIMMMMFFKGQFLSFHALIRTWLPFILFVGFIVLICLLL